MLPENAKKWVAKLRDPSVKQTTGTLHDRETDGYCCLGVACMLYQAEVGDLWITEIGIDGNARLATQYDGSSSLLPTKVMNWLGLATEGGVHYPSPEDADEGPSASLAELNDDGSTFQQIADRIEEEPLGLFDPAPR
jgi:hypothetical protein